MSETGIHQDSAFRKWWRRLWVAARAGAADFVHSRDYRFEFPESLLDPERSDRILWFLTQSGLVGRHRLHDPYRASIEKLDRVHTQPYLESLEHPDALLGVFGFRMEEHDRESLFEAHRLMTGGTLLATHLARKRRGLVVNLGGGFHHALPDRGQGFCVFHDVAVAIADARGHGFDGRVAVIDLDVHDGDGTRMIFAEDDRVHTYSIHNHHLMATDAVESTAIELGENVDDDTYLRTLEDSLPGMLERVRPDLAFFLAGADPAEDDRLGNWRITAEGMVRRDRRVLSLLRDDRPVPTVVLLAGGYGDEAWRYPARSLAAVLNRGRALEPPRTEDVTWARMRKVFDKLTPPDLVHDPDALDWELSADDIMPAVGEARGSRKFLGYYSKHGMELALERYGLLKRLRALGYFGISLAFDLDRRSGHTLRILAEGYPDTPLAEVRLLRDRERIPGMDLLYVEWLLLQNPRGQFTTERPRLPGQTRPGLGLLREVVTMLTLAVERLELDGLAATAGHYHLVARSVGYFRFVDPEDEARFGAFRDALDGVPLARATRLAESGQVVDRATGDPVPWQPTVVVHPVSDRLEAWLDAPERARHVADARARLDLTLSENGG